MTLAGAYSVSLAGIGLTCIPDPTHPGQQQPPGYDGTFAAQDPKLLIEKRDVSLPLSRFDKGYGVVRRVDETDDGAYAWGEKVITWLKNGVRPAGRIQANTVSSVANTGQIVGGVEFASDVWLAASVRCILQFASGDPSATPTAQPTAVNGVAFNAGVTGFRANYNPTCIAVFETAAGVPAIYVGTYDGTNTRLYEYTVAGGWAESAVLGFRIARLEVVFWTDESGVGALRLAAMIADNQIRHVIQGTNPLLAASWIAPIKVGTADLDIQLMLATPQTLTTVKRDGVWLVSALRAANATRYWKDNIVATNGLAGAILGDYLYVSRGWGIDRFPLTTDGRDQRQPGECGPSFGAQDGTPVIGYVTAMAVHEGSLLAYVYNPTNLTGYVMRGFPKQTWRANENPLQWHGAEAVVPSSGGVGFQCTHMRVGSPTVAVGSAQPTRSTYLWMCLVASSSPTTITIKYQPLPSGQGPISLAVSSGSFESEPDAKLILSAQDWGDDNSTKFVRRTDLRGQLVSATRTLALYSRADGDPTTIPTLGTWTLEGTATANSAKILPSPVTSGKTIGYQVLFTTPSPYTTAPILQSIAPRAKVVREVYKVRYLNVVLDRHAELATGATVPSSPRTTFTALAALQDLGPQTFVDENGDTTSVLVEQGIPFGRVLAEPESNDWRQVLRLELSEVA